MHQGQGSANKPEATAHAERVEAIAEEVCHKLWLSIPPVDVPEWALRIVSIPERRIRQILGVLLPDRR